MRPILLKQQRTLFEPTRTRWRERGDKDYHHRHLGDVHLPFVQSTFCAWHVSLTATQAPWVLRPLHCG